MRADTQGKWLAAMRFAGLGAALLGVLCAALLSRGSSLPERLDEMAFDAQIRLARPLTLPPAAPPAARVPDVVLVGLDEASLEALGLPMGQLQGSLGRALEALATAGTRAIGLDIALPVPSGAGLAALPDPALLSGVRAARAAGAFVLVLDLDAQGRIRPPSAPLLALAGGPDAFGLPLVPLDCDGVVRRFDPNAGTVRALPPLPCLPEAPRSAAQPAPALPGASIPCGFAACLARALGLGPALESAGWIDYVRGDAYRYIPLHEVLQHGERGDRRWLEAHFSGRVVLVGSVLPFLDRLPVPVPLASWESARLPVPGLLVHAQLVRNALGAGLLRPLPWPLMVLAAALGACLGMISGARRRWLALAGLAVTGIGGGTLLLAGGYWLPPADALLAGGIAVVARGLLDLGRMRLQRARLAAQLGGYLSPHLLQAMFEDRAPVIAQRGTLAFLFADLQGFTRRSEAGDPERIHALLNRYFACITPLLHAAGGTIDNFRGDGIMVLFGARWHPPAAGRRRVASVPVVGGSCDRALAAARAVLAAVDDLNRELERERIAPLVVTIGLAYGDAVYGELGSVDRRDFTALGDCVNLAAHLQALAKVLSCPVLMTRAFADQLQQGTAGLQVFGPHRLKEHSPVEVLGWPRAPLPPGGTAWAGGVRPDGA